MKFSHMLATSAAMIALATTAAAQNDEVNGWTGEGSLSAGVSTGNTETTDLGLGVKAKRAAGLWTFGAEAAADYGETDSVETKNRIFFATNLDRQLNDKLFGFGTLSYEKDEFSGFSSRTFAGLGLGYEIYNTDALGWTVRGGPGFKVDEIDANGIDPATTEESFGAVAESNARYIFNENVGLTNDTKVLYAQESTQISNISALTATLTDTLSARISFEARHDTNPPFGFEATDTVSRVSLVYGFGKWPVHRKGRHS